MCGSFEKIFEGKFAGCGGISVFNGRDDAGEVEDARGD